MAKEPEQKRSLFDDCQALREEVARIIQKSREERSLFKKRRSDESWPRRESSRRRPTKGPKAA